jgi:hypothetical protein
LIGLVIGGLVVRGSAQVPIQVVGRLLVSHLAEGDFPQSGDRGRTSLLGVRLLLGRGRVCLAAILDQKVSGHGSANLASLCDETL